MSSKRRNKDRNSNSKSLSTRPQAANDNRSTSKLADNCKSIETTGTSKLNSFKSQESKPNAPELDSSNAKQLFVTSIRPPTLPSSSSPAILSTMSTGTTSTLAFQTLYANRFPNAYPLLMPPNFIRNGSPNLVNLPPPPPLPPMPLLPPATWSPMPVLPMPSLQNGFLPPPNPPIISASNLNGTAKFWLPPPPPPPPPSILPPPNLPAGWENRLPVRVVPPPPPFGSRPPIPRPSTNSQTNR